MSRRTAALAAIVVCVLGALPLLALGMRPMSQQPYTDSAQYASAAVHLAEGDGYVVNTEEPYVIRPGGEGEVRPQYPPGYPVLLAGFELAGDIEWGPPLLAVALLVAVVTYAWRLGGAAAGMVCAVALCWSPFLIANARIYMADVTGALLCILVLLASSRCAHRATGLLAGAALAVRLTSITTLLVVLVLSPHRRKIAMWAAPPVLALMAFQWVAYGSPISTGYGGGEGLFWIDHLWSTGLDTDPDLYSHEALAWQVPQVGIPGDLGWPSPLLYAVVLLGGFWLFAPPLLPLAGVVDLWRRRSAGEAQLAIGVAAANVAVFLLYYHQAPRFMAPSALILVAHASVTVARWVQPGLDAGAEMDPAPTLVAPPAHVPR